MSSLGIHILIFLPIVAAAAVWMLPQDRDDLIRRLSLACGIVVAVVSLLLYGQVGGAGLVGETNAGWVIAGGGPFGLGTLQIRYHVGIDAISGPLVALTGVLVPLSIACGFTAIRRRQREYYFWMLLLTSAMFGVFVARDVLLFYIFFEFTLIPLYFLIGIWGGTERRYAANKFFLYTFAGSVLTFAGLLYLAVRAAQITGSPDVDFDLLKLSSIALSHEGGLSSFEQSLLFAALFAGFAIKVPFFPFHTWLPLAHTEAPTAGSVLLAGVLLKLGTYGFLRLAVPIVPEGALAWAHVMGVLAIAGIIYGALCCWVQRDVKKLVAYSSVSHLGFCMLGMFSFFPAGLSGSVLYMVNHGISTGALFLVVGMIYERYHTRDMHAIGGLARRMPVLAFFLVLFALSSIGLPGLNGFISEFTTLFGAYNSSVLGPWYGAAGALGILLGAIYMLYMVGRVLFGPLTEPPNTPDTSQGLTEDLTPREIATLVPLAILVVALGVAPRLITDTLDPILENEILARVRSTPTWAAIEGKVQSAECRVAMEDGAVRLAGTWGPDALVWPGWRGPVALDWPAQRAVAPDLGVRDSPASREASGTEARRYSGHDARDSRGRLSPIARRGRLAPMLTDARRGRLAPILHSALFTLNSLGTGAP